MVSIAKYSPRHFTSLSISATNREDIQMLDCESLDAKIYRKNYKNFMKDNQFCIIIYEKMSVNNQVMPRNTSKSVVPNVELGSITVEWTVLLKEFALVLDWKMQHVRAFC